MRKYAANNNVKGSGMWAIKIAATVLGLVVLAGCAPDPIKLTDGASAVKVAKADPPDNYTEIGPVTAVDGSGCGAFGYRGSYDQAVLRLKNAVHHMGGDYAEIVTLTEPHFEPGCHMNSYIIHGTAFKKTADFPSPIAIRNAGNKSGADQLRELKKLLDDNVITQQEFEQQKAKILARGLIE